MTAPFCLLFYLYMLRAAPRRCKMEGPCVCEMSEMDYPIYCVYGLGVAVPAFSFLKVRITAL